jgi:hypothetical protein
MSENIIDFIKKCKNGRKIIKSRRELDVKTILWIVVQQSKKHTWIFGRILFEAILFGFILGKAEIV